MSKALTTFLEWFKEQPDQNFILQGLTKDSVRNHKNHRKGTRPENEHYQSSLPTRVPLL
jgi:hypothetical protein